MLWSMYGDKVLLNWGKNNNYSLYLPGSVLTMFTKECSKIVRCYSLYVPQGRTHSTQWSINFHLLQCWSVWKDNSLPNKLKNEQLSSKNGQIKAQLAVSYLLPWVSASSYKPCSWGDLPRHSLIDCQNPHRELCTSTHTYDHCLEVQCERRDKSKRFVSSSILWQILLYPVDCVLLWLVPPLPSSLIWSEQCNNKTHTLKSEDISSYFDIYQFVNFGRFRTLRILQKKHQLWL